MSLRTLAALALAAASSPALAADGPHPFTVDDLVALRRLGEFRVSPDGGRIVYGVSTVDLGANKRRTDLWLVNADGTGARQLTHTPESEASPRWSPDGKAIYFLAKRGGETTQVFRLPLDGGEASAATALPLDVGSFEVAPDGKGLLVSLEVYPDCADLACTVDRAAAKAKEKATGRVYKELLFRHWDEWEDGLRAHVFAVSFAAPGEARDLMKGMDVDCPTKPFGGDDDYALTPDGKGVVFSAKDVGRAAAWSTNFDLFLAPLDGSAAPRKLTTNEAWDAGPVFSPDGKWLAYRAMRTPGYEADRWRILVRAWPGGAEKELAAGWDRSPHGLTWSADGKTLYATADSLGHTGLFAIDVASAAVKELVSTGSVGAVAVAKGKLLVARDDLRSPADLYTLRPDGTGLAAITKLNADLVTGFKLGEAEQFTFAGWNGEKVHAWLVKPVGFDPAKKWPIAFLIHGGPQGSFGDHFHYRWNPQTYAGAGYAAIMVDFHGSTGYGQAFSDSIGGDWGGKPLEDLQKGLAAALAKYPFLDGDRVAALGASYGGYMINWIAGAWPDRFRCLVAHDGNLDERFAYFATEELWFPERDHGGTPWENPASYEKHNPLNLVKNWKTPILVIHGGKDFRVVETEGMATFTAAQRRGVPSELLYFPDENHWVVKPLNSIQWHKAVLGWLDRWTKPAEAPKATPVAGK